MAVKPSITTENESETKFIKEEIKFQYFWYLFTLFAVYLGSLIIPALLFIAYLIFFFLPNFLEIKNFVVLFTEFKPLIAWIFMPLVLIGCYILRIFLTALITRGFWSYCQRKSPSKEGIIPRNFPSRILKYYHIRSFLIKQGKNTFTKGMFPWLINWFYNFVGTNIIRKGTTLEESPSNDKFIEVGENSYVGVNSSLASHVVEGIFGNISYFKVKVGNNFTAAGMNVVGPGSEINDNAFLLPLASATKHSVIKGDNFYWGIPLRKIFRKKTMELLDLSVKDLERNKNIEGYKDNPQLIASESKSTSVVNSNPHEDSINDDNIHTLTKEDLALDFTTSSSISRVNIKFLVVYIPIFWLSGMVTTIFFYTFTELAFSVQYWYIYAFFLPTIIFIMWFIFIMTSIFFSKLFLLLINLIHRPREGIFKAEIGDKDFEFWCLRTELKKIVLWLIRNWPLPWMDILAFKWFGIKMSLDSTMWDSWCDSEFIKLGRNVLIGQGATVMSSLVIGKYLLIKEVILGDYTVIGGEATISPGTIIGNDSVVGALSTTTYNQILEPGWIYFGIPVIKLKENKYAELKREVLMKKDVDEEKKFEVEHEVNIDEDKKGFI
ncbi:MAG: acyltransferase [Promethearchaeota archaeon]